MVQNDYQLAFYWTFLSPIIDSLIQSVLQSFICLFVHSFTCLFVCLFLHTFFRLLFCLLVRLFFRLFVPSFICSYWFTHSVLNHKKWGRKYLVLTFLHSFNTRQNKMKSLWQLISLATWPSRLIRCAVWIV